MYDVLLDNMEKDILSMINIKKLLGKRIKFYREKKKMTQEQLAENIGINSRSLSLIECGTNFVTAQTLENIASALEISPKKLFDFEEEDENKKIKDRLLKLINENEDKISTIYRIIKGYLD